MKYIFRNIVILEYNPILKQVTIPKSKELGINFNYCRFIPEDYQLMSDFFNVIYDHTQGKIPTEVLEDFRVN